MAILRQLTLRPPLRSCMVSPVPSKWERRNDQIERIRQSLKTDPPNLRLASRYWSALAEGRCGRDVIVAFRESAIASTAGAVAFARAYLELFHTSGECPRHAYFDDRLIKALQASLSELSGTERANVHWVLQSIGVMQASG